MSFVKKAVKKVVGFVKKYWKEILIVAAIVFTAGVATVGFSYFGAAAGQAGFGGFMSAVGSTMVQGVAAIGSAVGIGSGAVVGGAGLGGSTALAGTSVGFGAAAGLGGGAGIGAGSAVAEANLAALATPTAPVAAGSGQAAFNYAAGTKIGATAQAVQAATPTVLASGALPTTIATTAPAATKGLSLAGVGKLLSGVGAVAGPAMKYYGDKKAAEADYPLASWGVPVGRGDAFYEDPANYMPGAGAAPPVMPPPTQPPLAPVGTGALAQQAGGGVGVPSGQQPLMSLMPFGQPMEPDPLLGGPSYG
jgi:hypothetical protein